VADAWSLKRRCLDHSVLVSLEALVPRDHFYRQLEARLELAFVRALAHSRYEATERPSIDPVVLFKFQLILFFEGSARSASEIRPYQRTLQFTSSAPRPAAPTTAGLNVARKFYNWPARRPRSAQAASHDDEHEE